MSINLDKYTKAYLQLRDRKAQLKQKHKTELEPVETAMSQIEAKILEFFNETGQESARTAYGTPYTVLRETVSVGNRDDFLGFVRAEQAWDMVENRANKTAVLAYRDEHGELPPGLSYRAERVVNVKSK